MKEIELIEKRKPREKHFLQEDGTIRAELYGDDIHYLKNGKYEEIDNTLIEKNGYYSNKSNGYKAHFSKSSKHDLFTIEDEKHFLSMYLKNNNDVTIKNNSKDKSKLKKFIKYNSILDGIDFEYQLLPTKVKENIIIHSKKNIQEIIEFMVDTDLILILNDDKSISALYNEKEVFKIEAPYMFDSNNEFNYNIHYELIKNNDNYKIKLILDEEWLSKSERKFPIFIDPTVTNSSQNTQVYDTYIYPGDTNVNRSTQEYFKVGVDRVNGNDVVNRALIKFDLPAIGTGSQVINATLNIVNYPDDVIQDADVGNLLSVHQITTDWTESGANWNNMNSNYNNRVEDVFTAQRSYADYNGQLFLTKYYSADITKIVKKWYTNTPNYGLLLKAYNEVYENDFVCAFFSKNNTVGGDNPQPVLAVTYRNQNGILEYMNYREQRFQTGISYVNTYNGNLVCSFDCWNSAHKNFPWALNIIYNTNDVILDKNYGCGKGWKFNLSQSIEKDTKNNWLAYTDEDGTILYFKQKPDEYERNDGRYYDEDELNLIISEEENRYVMVDIDGNQYIFTKLSDKALLSKMISVDGNTEDIYYDSNNRISRFENSKGESLSFEYTSNMVNISNEFVQISLILNNNHLVSISKPKGTINIEYNSKEIINKIIDFTGKGIGYEYYNELPYRIKKVIEYGTNNDVGQTLEFDYSFNCTVITDNKGRINNLGYNSYGSVLTNSDFKDDKDVKNAHSLNYLYDMFEPVEKHGETMPIRYTKNYLKNSSFENEGIYFHSNDNLNISLTDEFAYSGTYSMKFVSNVENTKVYQNVIVPKFEGYYTFSAYMKNTGKVKLGLSYLDENNNLVEEISDLIYPSDEFERNDVTIKYSTNASSALTINIYLLEASTTYIDDIQLEEGEAASSHNFIENSNFLSGLEGWTISGDNPYEIIELSDNNNALVVDMKMDKTTTLSMNFDLCGKDGDLYCLSFWYKNEGLNTRFDDVLGTCCRTVTWLNFGYEDDTIYVPPATVLDNDNDEWRYFTATFSALGDFSSINFSVYLSKNVNKFYITDLYLHKDYKQSSYIQDFDGNLISTTDFSGNSSDFTYNSDNQLVKMMNPKGNNFVFEYDNNVKTRVLKGVSANGIANETKYDSYGNPKYCKIINRGLVNHIDEDKYKIRLKGTKKFLRVIQKNILAKEDEFELDGWNIISDNSKYKFESIMFPGKYLNEIDENIVLGDYNSNFSLFELIEQSDGSYAIMSSTTNKCLCINAEEEVGIFSTELENISENNKFYLEKYNLSKFIEHSAHYDLSNNFVTMLEDSNFKQIEYEFDEDRGLNTKVINPMKHIVEYEYNQNDDQIKKVKIGDKEINYIYDSKNFLEEIEFCGKHYKIDYNSFLNISKISVNDNVLSIKEYENGNGKVSKITYGNDAMIKYFYDDFDRISILEKMDDEFQYKYNNNGNLTKVISNNELIKFDYDSSQRLRKYRKGDFEIDYNYSINNNLVNKIYRYKDIVCNLDYNYDSDENIIKIEYDTNFVDFNYDELGRVNTISVNDSLNTNYKYFTNGYRTSLLTKEFDNGFNNYTYKYNDMSNITHIYKDNILISKYFYDEYNQLIRECDYIRNYIINYKYDLSGNIISKKIVDLNNFALIDEVKYQYNDLGWNDKLTNINDVIITYDEIGNPITIGNDITFTWQNGRELQKYENGNCVALYKYDANGIRISKNVNNVETKYYLDGTQIIFEVCGDDVIYYLKNECNGIIGFKYNGQTYFYLKNLCDDIVGIIDSNSNVVANYCYDAYGNIIAITDENGLDISGNSSHIANINNYRYRGYYYDKESGYYYLNSRYYDPRCGRFINADGIINANHNVTGFNLYIYASNNPMNQTDASGKGLFAALAIAAVVGAVVGVAGQFVSDVVNSVMSGKKKFSSKADYIGSAVGGAVGGVCTVLGVDPLATAGWSSATANATTTMIELSTTKKKFDQKKFLCDIAEDTALSFVSGEIMNGLDMPGITNGRNSYSAVFKTGLTKIANDNQTKMSAKVMLKGFSSNFVTDTLNNWASGMKGYCEDVFEVDNCFVELLWDK